MYPWPGAGSSAFLPETPKRNIGPAKRAEIRQLLPGFARILSQSPDRKIAGTVRKGTGVHSVRCDVRFGMAYPQGYPLLCDR